MNQRSLQLRKSVLHYSDKISFFKAKNCGEKIIYFEHYCFSESMTCISKSRLQFFYPNWDIARPNTVVFHTVQFSFKDLNV